MILPFTPVTISRSDDLEKAQHRIEGFVGELNTEHKPVAIIAPSNHDAHHGHEVVARAVRESMKSVSGSRLWLWNIWGELPYPNLYSPFDQSRLDKVLYSLQAYKGENERNNYPQMVLGRALLGSVLGSEKIFGFGAGAVSGEPYAELLTEVVNVDGRWMAGQK